MPRSYIYSDLDSTLKINNSGNFAIKYDKESIIQSIKLLMATVSGERVRNRIGSNLLGLLFEPMNQDTIFGIKTVLSRAIAEYEPRVSVLDIRVTPEYDRNWYEVVMILEIKKINERIKFETRLRAMGEQL